MNSQTQDAHCAQISGLGVTLCGYYPPSQSRFVAQLSKEVREGRLERTSFMVGEKGVEPSHPYGYRNLNPARLPIPPLAREMIIGSQENHSSGFETVKRSRAD